MFYIVSLVTRCRLYNMYCSSRVTRCRLYQMYCFTHVTSWTLSRSWGRWSWAASRWRSVRPVSVQNSIKSEMDNCARFRQSPHLSVDQDALNMLLHRDAALNQNKLQFLAKHEILFGWWACLRGNKRDWRKCSWWTLRRVLGRALRGLVQTQSRRFLSYSSRSASQASPWFLWQNHWTPSTKLNHR